MPKMKHQPPFPYYGAKATIAPWIVSNLPEHERYIEPFFGSGAVLLAKAPCRVEVANDLNGQVVNFFKVLRDWPQELIEVLQLTPYARDEFLATQVPAVLSELEQARQFFVRCNMGFNGQESGGFSASAPAIKNGELVKLGKDIKPQAFIKRIDSRLSVIAERLRSVEFENMDALKLMDRWNYQGVVAYLDPPYLSMTRNSANNYANDNSSMEFHEALVEKIRNWRGTVVLSGYPNPLYDSLGWRRVSQLRNTPTSNVAGELRVECLWINNEKELT